MAINFNRQLLRGGPCEELAVHFQSLLKVYPEQEILTHLLDLFQKESISPKILEVWLGIAKSPKTILVGLKQDFSVYFRRCAIKRFSRCWSGKRWKEFWDAIGGIPGILSLLEQFSVEEVSNFMSEMSKHTNGAERREIMTQLHQSLQPSRYPDAVYKNADERPIYWVFNLFPACDEEYIKNNFVSEDGEILADKKLFEKFYTLFQNHLMDINNWHNRKPDLPSSQLLVSLAQNAPPLPSTKPLRGFSESMRFSFDLLTLLVAQVDPNYVNAYKIQMELINPLLRRAWKRRRSIGWDKLREIITLCIRFTERWPLIVGQMKYEEKGLFYHTVILWALSPSNWSSSDHNLVMFLEKLNVGSHQDFWKTVHQVLKWVRLPLRYTLLNLVFRHHGTRSIYIENKGDLQGLDVGKWPPSVFLEMDRHEALQLLQRLCSAKGDGFLDDHNDSGSILKWSFGDGLPLLLGVLGDPLGAEKGMAKSMTRSIQNRWPNDRSDVAVHAMCCAISTGSLDKCKEAVIWAKRFLKDPLASKAVFSGPFNTNEGLNLLSGIPPYPGQELKITVNNVVTRVNKANEIILELFKIICLALKEPFFAKYHWTSALSLSADVIRRRASDIYFLVQDLKLSTDEIYHAVWKTTISLVIQIERLSLQEGHRSNLGYGPSGPLQHLSLNSITPQARVQCFRFINDLARERDALWKEFRILSTPAVTILPNYITHGLPLQNLLGNEAKDSKAVGLTPFLFTRAKEIVFPDPTQILTPVPEDKEIRNALSGFVDNYKLALDIYIAQSSSEEERQERIEQAWVYAIDKLSLTNGRMTRQEAYLTWYEKYKEYGLSREICPVPYAISIRGFLLPSDVDGNETLEWNPADNFSIEPAVKSRELQLTFLDYSIQTDLNLYSRPGSIMKAQTTQYSPQPLGLWDSLWLEEEYLREGILLSTLLYLDSKIKGPRSILSSPFPSDKAMRYPAVYLADEFLQQNYLVDDTAFIILESHHWQIIPPSLILNVTRAALNAVAKNTDSSENANMIKRAYQLLRLLIRSDNPSLAIDLVLDTILDRPEDSSWHRQLLTKKFLLRLPAENARDLIRKFSASIQARLIQQSKQIDKAPEGNAASSSTKRTFVKVTTVKQLAQLLTNSLFISRTFAIEVLVDLIQNASHIDILVAVIDSLLEKLKDCTEAHEEKIILGLEFLIPVAGCVNERQPLTEEKWKEAEKTQTPPTIPYADDKKKALDSKGAGMHLVIFQVLDNATNYYPSTTKRGLDLTQKLKSRIIFPILQQSISSNTRWLKIFAAKYFKSDLSSLRIPMLPLYPDALFNTLNRSYWENIPSWIPRVYFQFIMTNLAPSRKLLDFNEKLKDPALQSNPDVIHWLWLYGRRKDFNPSQREAMIFDAFFLRKLHYWQDSYDGKDCMQLDETSRYAFAQAKLLALAYSATGEFDAFMDTFWVKNDQANDYGVDYDSLGKARPVIKNLIADIDSLRSQEWQSNPSRKPAILQSTLKYRLWFLPRPFPQSKSLISDEKKVSTYCEAIRRVVQEICADGKPYHMEFQVVRTAILETHRAYNASVACELGSLKDDLNLEDFLCIELAEALFTMQNSPRDTMVITRTREVIFSWQRSKYEVLRLKGRRLGFLESYDYRPWGETVLNGDGTPPVPDIRRPNPETYVWEMLDDFDGSWINIGV